MIENDIQLSNIIASAPGEKAAWQKPYGAGMSLAISALAQYAQRPIVIIANDNVMVSHLIDELHFFGIEPYQLTRFTDWEILPYDHFSPHQDIVSERLAALYQLSQKKSAITITTVATAMQRIIPRTFLDRTTFLLQTGDKFDTNAFRERLVNAGYRIVTQVNEHGEFAIRGSLFDIYPMGSPSPFRIDLFDNEVESIRRFSIETQLSTEDVNAIHLLPGKEYDFSEDGIQRFRQNFRENFAGNPLNCPTYTDVSNAIATPGIECYLPLFFETTATLFDYLSKDTLIITIDQLSYTAQTFWHEIESRYRNVNIDMTRPLLPPARLYLNNNQLQECLQPFSQLRIVEQSRQAKTVIQTQALPNVSVDHKRQQPLERLMQFLQHYPGRVLFCVETAGRREVLRQTLQKIAIIPTEFKSWHDFIQHNDQVGIVISPIENGFQLQNPELAIITESQLFGERIMQRRLRKKATTDPDLLIRDLTELQVGSPIVHLEHGIGLYQGLKTLTVGDQAAEFLMLSYQNDDVLYVPIRALNMISRYTGANPDNIPINKLGTSHWQRTKRQAAEKICDVASELLDLYANRASREGFAFRFPEEPYQAFAAGFPFEETPDQQQAIDNVIHDLISTKPMDRVICGDVGFGKTEVAMRAAFIAAMNGKQTAVLVPTTLLAQQHLQNFLDRFADWPIKIAGLSRFKTKKQQDSTLADLAEGKIDIVIGTHKLIQDDIRFKSLGLIIIDEEHRFGVKQKEKLKALRSSVDILTLTATPIPRTLNMSLAGIRDLSIIATPPAKRLSVKTFVYESQQSIIKEAIQREILRGGQVYFLHNDVTSIDKRCQELANLVPEARPIVAHGQMHERDLERVMSDYYHRHYNVLVCTTIIESGIDIPTANTIIIHRADKLGIAQLHQLRGRVGRSHHQAYAYLLIPSKKSITNDALKRLDAIAAFDTLGIGFTLATHDLEIRGAGELLGEGQSGDMHAIGFSLYMDLLTRAVNAIKSGKTPDLEQSLIEYRTDIDLNVSALIPDDYLPDVQLRLQLYKRIASAKNEEALEQLQVEMIDRFGLLPQPCQNLFAIAVIKLKAEAVGITKIEANQKGGKFEFSQAPTINPARIIQLIQQKSETYRLDGPSRLRFTLAPHAANERIHLVNQQLQVLLS